MEDFCVVPHDMSTAAGETGETGDAASDARGRDSASHLTTSGVERLAFSPDSRTLAVTTLADVDVTLWRPAALRAGRKAGTAGADEVRPLQGLTGAPGAVVFSPDGQTVYSVADPDGVRAWSTSTFKPTGAFDPPP